MTKIREIVARLKKLWVISKTYDKQVDVLSKGIQYAHERVGRTLTVHGDIHHKTPSHIIVIGRYHSRDYVRIFDLDAPSFQEMVDALRKIEPGSRPGRFDTVMHVPFEVVYDRDTF